MNTEIRILHICALNPGGIETFVMNCYRELRKKDIVFDFINYFDRDKVQFHEEEVIKYGSKIYKTGSMNYKNPLIRHIHKCKSLYKFLKFNKYDTIHIHASDSISLEDAIIAKLAGVKKIIVHAHNTNINKSDKLYIIKKMFHNCVKRYWAYAATDYFACSEVAAEWLFSKELIESKSIKIINNAINPLEYKFNDEIRKNIRKKLNIEDKFVIGHIGRFTYQKNHEFLIEIFSELIKVVPNSTLLLIGSGELEEKIKNKVEEYNLSECVIFYGVSNECSVLMQAMDVFILPSHFEGLPLVGIEAQASGLKVISSNNVSKQMKITDNVKYIELTKPIQYWIDEIKGEYNRKKDMSQKIEKAGYGIVGVSKTLAEYYK